MMRDRLSSLMGRYFIPVLLAVYSFFMNPFPDSGVLSFIAYGVILPLTVFLAALLYGTRMARDAEHATMIDCARRLDDAKDIFLAQIEALEKKNGANN